MTSGLKLAIRHFRDEKGLKQDQCAEAACMTQTRDWSNLERERGRATISPTQLESVAQALGVTSDDLMEKAAELE